MTADRLQQAQTARYIVAFGKNCDKKTTSVRGFELTRLNTFLEGEQDIFDVLEQHTANKKKTSHHPAYEASTAADNVPGNHVRSPLNRAAKLLKSIFSGRFTGWFSA